MVPSRRDVPNQPGATPEPLVFSPKGRPKEARGNALVVPHISAIAKVISARRLRSGLTYFNAGIDRQIDNQNTFAAENMGISRENRRITGSPRDDLGCA